MSDQRPIVELHIDELVLHGFPPSDRHCIAEALQSELTRLFSQHSHGKAAPRSVTIGQLNAEAFRVAPGAKPASIGAQVGQSVYRQLAPALWQRQKRTGRR